MDKQVETSLITEQVIGALKKEAVNWVIKRLVIKAAWMGSWFMSPILNFIVPMIIDALYDYGALGINWLWMLVENHLELKTAIKTKENLQAILKAGGDYTKAEEEFDDATDSLIEHNFNRLPR